MPDIINVVNLILQHLTKNGFIEYKKEQGQVQNAMVTEISFKKEQTDVFVILNQFQNGLVTANVTINIGDIIYYYDSTVELILEDIIKVIDPPKLDKPEEVENEKG
jgi:hypothetical protein